MKKYNDVPSAKKEHSDIKMIGWIGSFRIFADVATGEKIAVKEQLLS